MFCVLALKYPGTKSSFHGSSSLESYWVSGTRLFQKECSSIFTRGERTCCDRLRLIQSDMVTCSGPRFQTQACRVSESVSSTMLGCCFVSECSLESVRDGVHQGFIEHQGPAELGSRDWATGRSPGL